MKPPVKRVAKTSGKMLSRKVEFDGSENALYLIDTDCVFTMYRGLTGSLICKGLKQSKKSCCCHTFRLTGSLICKGLKLTPFFFYRKLLRLTGSLICKGLKPNVKLLGANCTVFDWLPDL
jgi:hypothetical protein